MSDKAAIKQYLDELGLEMVTMFVPFSISRNAKEKYPSLNYKVTITRKLPPPQAPLHRTIIETDYMMGCGHVPGYKQSSLIHHQNYLRQACEEGKVPWHDDAPRKMVGKYIRPELVDVMYSLVMDADALQYDTYEDWAASYGYEEDSRKGEKIYNECRRLGSDLRKLVSYAGLEKLQELYQDY